MKNRTLACLLVLFALCTVLPATAAELARGAGRFEVTHEGRTIPVWYFRPEEAGAGARVLIVMHGVNRDADRYRDEWLPYARQYGFILAAPEFSQAAFPGDDGYTLGKLGAFAFIEPVFDAVKAGTGNRSERYFLYGHSAGAQFVHRFLYFVPGARVEKAVAANAGWWTLPDPGVKFPYGLDGSGVNESALKTALQRPLIVLLGTADTDPNHVHLRRTPEALAQGPHRFARGHTFFAAGKARAAAMGVPLGWQLSTAPGVDHNDGRMAPFAVKLLFGQPATAGHAPAP
jgi:poly(3-hydroxybutyrate) depolymerase